MLLIDAIGMVGCTWQEGICSEGEYPVYALTNKNGGMCVRNGDPVPNGFAAYPDGRVPKSVNDKYDRWPLAKTYPWRDEVDPKLLRLYGN